METIITTSKVGVAESMPESMPGSMTEAERRPLAEAMGGAEKMPLAKNMADTKNMTGAEGVTTTDIFCQRGDFTLAIDSLSLKKGEKIAILGENGCGKTTLLQVLTGLLPAKGNIEYDKKPWKRFSTRERSHYVAFLPQEADVLFNLTVGELLELRLDDERPLQGEERQAALEATSMVDFQKRIFHSLSMGEKRRAMLARVFCRDCPYIFLDEPTAPLDLRHAAELMRYISNIPKTVVAAIHDVNLAVRYFDRFLLMKNGRILFDRSKKNLAVAELEEIYGIALNDCGGFFMPDV